MARPLIDDDAVLIAIARRILQHPKESFSRTVGHVKWSLTNKSHSEDSLRRRLSRKFRAQPEHWLELGKAEIREEQAEHERSLRVKREQGAREEMLRFVEASNPFRRDYRNWRRSIEEAARQLEQLKPEMDAMLAFYNSAGCRAQRGTMKLLLDD